MDENTVALAQEQGLDITDYLQRADAGNALAQLDLLVTTGPTGTNVMDLCVVVVE